MVSSGGRERVLTRHWAGRVRSNHSAGIGVWARSWGFIGNELENEGAGCPLERDFSDAVETDERNALECVVIHELAS